MRSDLRQAANAVPLSSSSIISYWPKSGNTL